MVLPATKDELHRRASEQSKLGASKSMGQVIDDLMTP